MLIKQPTYRIVTDEDAGFECQIKFWYWPFYIQVETNTHCNIDNAKIFILKDRRKREFKSIIVLSDL